MNDTAKPLITTIIPTYRRPKLLRRAIKSVLNQTYPHFQVCVYDNASGDETASVVAEMAIADTRVKYHCHSQNSGAVKNFTYGMERVETPFFSFLSDDDILLPEFYQTAMAGFDKFPDAMFSVGSCIYMTEEREVTFVPLSLWQRDGYYTPPNGLLEMMDGKHPVWTAILFRKEVVEEIGILDEDTGGAVDLDFELRAAARFPFVISKKPCAIFLVHSRSYCGSATFRSFWPGWHKIIRNLAADEEIPANVRAHIEHMLTEQIKRMLFRFGIKAIKGKNFGDAYKLCEILNGEYHQKMRATILYALAKLGQHSALFYHFLVYLNRIRKFVNLRRIRTSKRLQEQFSDCVEYIRMIESG